MVLEPILMDAVRDSVSDSILKTLESLCLLDINNPPAKVLMAASKSSGQPLGAEGPARKQDSQSSNHQERNSASKLQEFEQILS